MSPDIHLLLTWYFDSMSPVWHYVLDLPSSSSLIIMADDDQNGTGVDKTSTVSTRVLLPIDVKKKLLGLTTAVEGQYIHLVGTLDVMLHYLSMVKHEDIV